MSDNLDALPEPSATEVAALDALLARAEIWEEPPAELEDRVVAAIEAEVASAGISAHETAASQAAPVAQPVSLDQHRARRRGGVPWWAAAAAALAVVVGGIALISSRASAPDGTVIALAGTEAAPDASARVTLSAGPAGLKILLDTDGLAAAPVGYFYEAWVSDGTKRVSAGTFHLRDGSDEIELWAGVADPTYNRLSVTLEPLDGVTAPSGDVRLTGTFQLD